MSHGAPLAVGWLLQSPREQRTYMAAFNLMSLHMRSQQGKGMPALLIPLHWPYISAGCQSRGLHPERLRRQKQLDEKTDRRACLCLSERVYLKNASYRLKIIAQLWNDQMLLLPSFSTWIFIAVSLVTFTWEKQSTPCYSVVQYYQGYGDDGNDAGFVKKCSEEQWTVDWEKMNLQLFW